MRTNSIGPAHDVIVWCHILLAADGNSAGLLVLAAGRPARPTRLRPNGSTTLVKHNKVLEVTWSLAQPISCSDSQRKLSVSANTTGANTPLLSFSLNQITNLPFIIQTDGWWSWVSGGRCHTADPSALSSAPKSFIVFCLTASLTEPNQHVHCRNAKSNFYFKYLNTL